MSSSNRTAAGPSLLPGSSKAASATQAAWRFFNNERVELTALAEPLRQMGRQACAKSASKFVLMAHDWSKINYKNHKSKKDLRQLTHQHDVGYDMTTALLLDAHDGNPLAPMQMHVKTARQIHTTASKPLNKDTHHLDQLEPTMEESNDWDLAREVVHVIDREGDSLGDFRRWNAAGHCFLVRCDDRRVLWKQEALLISEIVDYFDREVLFKDIGTAVHHGKSVRQEVADTEILLHGRHKTSGKRKQLGVPHQPLQLRLVITRLLDDEGFIVAQWTLLTNVGSDRIEAHWIATWYYWRWQIESFFKLLKGHGQEIEHWQQESGEAIARRLLVAAMACVVVWQLERDTSNEGEATKKMLIRLSGRSMKRGRPYTAPALLAGYMSLLAISDLIEHTDGDMRKLKAFAKNVLPFENSS